MLSWKIGIKKHIPSNLIRGAFPQSGFTMIFECLLFLRLVFINIRMKDQIKQTEAISRNQTKKEKKLAGKGNQQKK